MTDLQTYCVEAVTKVVIIVTIIITKILHYRMPICLKNKKITCFRGKSLDQLGNILEDIDKLNGRRVAKLLSSDIQNLEVIENIDDIFFDNFKF